VHELLVIFFEYKMEIQWQTHHIHSENYGQKVLHAHPNHMNTMQFNYLQYHLIVMVLAEYSSSYNSDRNYMEVLPGPFSIFRMGPGNEANALLCE